MLTQNTLGEPGSGSERTLSGVLQAHIRSHLVEHFDELTEFFEPDREIVTFQDERELVEKARFYLAHDRERERIRLAGMRRARAEHTWHKRFQGVFSHVSRVRQGKAA